MGYTVIPAVIYIYETSPVVYVVYIWVVNWNAHLGCSSRWTAHRLDLAKDSDFGATGSGLEPAEGLRRLRRLRRLRTGKNLIV